MNQIRLRLLTAAALALLCGCAGAPAKLNVSQSLPARFENTLVPSGQEKWPQSNWWLSFNDAQLNTLVATVLAQNPSVAQAKARFLAARALRPKVVSAFLPNVSARTFSASTIESTSSYFQPGFDAVWELPIFQRRNNNLRANAADAAIAAIDLEAIRVSLSAEVVRGYAQLRMAQRQFQFVQAITALEAKKFELLQRRVADGLSARGEILAAQTVLNSTRQEQIAAQDGIELNVMALAALRADALLPKRHRTGFGTSTPPLKAPDTLPTLPVELLRRRPEVQRAEQEAIKANAELGIAAADLYPMLSLGGSLNYAFKIEGDALLAPRNIISLGPVFSLPLLDWGARRAQVNSLTALQAAALANYRAQLLAAVTEAETALKNFAIKLRERSSAVAEQKLAQQRFSLAKRSLSAGFSDQIAICDARIARLQTRQSLLQAEYAQTLSYIAMAKVFSGALENENQAQISAKPAAKKQALAAAAARVELKAAR